LNSRDERFREQSDVFHTDSSTDVVQKEFSVLAVINECNCKEVSIN
jgi:hypothetical protein